MLRSHPPTGLNFEWQKRIGLGYLILLRFRVASPVESLRFACGLEAWVENSHPSVRDSIWLIWQALLCLLPLQPTFLRWMWS